VEEKKGSGSPNPKEKSTQIDMYMIEGARGREAESPRGAAPREPPRETHSSERRLARDLLELEVVPALLLLGGLEDVARVDFA